jgi:hypothetical protein
MISPHTSHSTVIMTYYTLFHSIMTCAVIFWGSSSHSQNILKIQKMAIRIIMEHESRDSCRNLLKKFETLPLKSQYIFSLLSLVINNQDLFVTHSENHNIQTRLSYNLYLPLANLTIYEQGVHYSGIKRFNKLPL